MILIQPEGYTNTHTKWERVYQFVPVLVAFVYSLIQNLSKWCHLEILAYLILVIKFCSFALLNFQRVLFGIIISHFLVFLFADRGKSWGRFFWEDWNQSQTSLMSTLKETRRKSYSSVFKWIGAYKSFFAKFCFCMCSRVHTIWNEVHKEQRQTIVWFPDPSSVGDKLAG